MGCFTTHYKPNRHPLRNTDNGLKGKITMNKIQFDNFIFIGYTTGQNTTDGKTFHTLSFLEYDKAKDGIITHNVYNPSLKANANTPFKKFNLSAPFENKQGIKCGDRVQIELEIVNTKQTRFLGITKIISRSNWAVENGK